MQPVLGHDGGMRQPGPASVGVGKELTVDELEHLRCLGSSGDLRIDLRRHQQGILADRVQLEDALEPGLDLARSPGPGTGC